MVTKIMLQNKFLVYGTLTAAALAIAVIVVVGYIYLNKENPQIAVIENPVHGSLDTRGGSSSKSQPESNFSKKPTVDSLITVTENADPISRYGIYELSIAHDDAQYTNPWEDVSISVQFTGPSKKRYSIDGFYYNTDQWKVRFTPPIVGRWKWSLTFTTPTDIFTEKGSLRVSKSSRLGFVKQHPTNPFRLVYEDGSLFNGIVIQDCINNGIDSWGLDGEYGPEVRVSMDEYMTAYGSSGAGFNLFRWALGGCVFKAMETISPNGNRYSVQGGLWGDQLVESLRKNDFRIWLLFFDRLETENYYPYAADNPAEQEAVKRFIGYLVARYGAYVDIWELNGEAPLPTDNIPLDVWERWITFTSDYLRSIDPFNRLISISWASSELHGNPALPQIDINAPHWYQNEDELTSDLVTSNRISEQRAQNKPIIFGEQGNQSLNWDERSGLRMRLRSWTAFFEEAILIPWNTSAAKMTIPAQFAANLYIGPEERSYIRTLQDFTTNIDPDAKRFTLTPSTSDVRAYGLQSSSVILGYFHHFIDHTNSVTTNITINVPFNGTATWIDPATGDILQTSSVSSGTQTLTSPGFVVDVALKIQ